MWDPFDYTSIIDAMKDCSGLFYTFEPLQDQQPSYDEFAAEVEVRTAHNVLEACAQTETIARVVFTSSITAVVWRENRKSTADVDERHWSDPNFCRKYKLWHALAKTVSEKTAWALAMDRGVDMVSINAGLVMGQELGPSSPYLKGAAEMYEEGTLVAVDLKFLVDAHVCAYECASAYGRYLCFNHVINSPADALDLVRVLSPDDTPSPTSSGDLRLSKQKIQNKKLNQLMVEISSGEIMSAAH
ncbi:Tetraketide alpha-pyrone reductase 2 [Acorus calamus]|uniref:Tetraketide alpha-pyrone reductase 2 n=1 Tax=Acorus calamus TaxID=4465 RepID=A0AAV9E259_ACOCL|nr:Tetraketide alpha-pyrone reductase 2 [Acorus calamus]